MRMKSPQILMECLLEQGVDTVFGYPGGTILNVYDELELHGYKEKIRHILTAHEQGASHAADGYARATGKVGVCFATSGPGATNLTTGIATAYYDSSPVVFITVNVAEPLVGKDTFQEVDITGISMPITKCNYLVRRAEDLADVIREAFAIARSGRPGPVLIDILKNVTYDEADYEFLPRSEHGKHGRLAAMLRRASHDLKTPEPDHSDIDKLLGMIEEAEKPLVLVGGGVIRSKGAVPEFRRFFERLNAPVASTIMGGGACPGSHPLFTGMIGMHGSHASNHAVSECDLLIVIGCRFSDRVAGSRNGFAPNAQVVHLDIDHAEFDKNVPAAVRVAGDLSDSLAALAARMAPADHTPWVDSITALRREPAAAPVDPDSIPDPLAILQTLRRLTPDDTIVATDVGQHQMWTAQHFPFTQPRTLLTSGGLGTMGYGLGAAIGAQCGMPERRVVLISGDGSFHMNLNELTTLASYELPVMNNQVLGMVRQWQKVFYENRFSSTDPHRKTDLVKLAEAFGCTGLRIARASDILPVLQAALDKRGPVVVDCRISPDANVLPMIPPGGTVEDMIESMDN